MRYRINSSTKLYFYISLFLLVMIISFIGSRILYEDEVKLSSNVDVEIDGFGEILTIPPKCFGIKNCGVAQSITGVGGSWKSLDEAKEESLEKCNEEVEERKNYVVNCVLNARTLCPLSDCIFDPKFEDKSGPCSLSDGEIIEPIVPYANNPANGAYCSIAQCKEIGKPLKWCVQVYDKDGKAEEKCVDYPSVICRKSDLDFVSFNCRAQDKWVYANPTCVDN